MTVVSKVSSDQDAFGSFYFSSTFFSKESGVDKAPGQVATKKVPDGGYGWVVAILALLLNAFLTMGLATFSILFVEFVDYFEASKTDVSWLAAIYLAAMMSACVHAETMSAVGVRRLGFCCSLVASLAYVGSSAVNDLRVLYVTFGLIPGSMFCYYGLAGIVTLHRWFDKKISFAMAINFSGIAVGHFAWAPLTSWLVGLYSWRGAVLILAAINLHCFVIFTFLKTPEEYYGPLYAKRQIVNTPKDNNGDIAQKSWPQRFIPDICKEPSYIAFHVLNILFNMSYLVGMSYLPTRYVLDGGARQTAAFLQALVGVTMGLLRPVHGLLGDRVARWRIWMFFTFEGLSGAALVCSALYDHFAWIATCAVIFASFAAGYVVLTLPTITDLWGRDSVPYIGAHLYVDNAIAGLILNPISGLLMDITGEATAPFLLFGSLQVMAVVLGFILVYTVQGRAKRTEAVPSSADGEGT